MYVRVKKIGSRRYAYLVVGVSKNGRVSQKTIAYLGPVWKMALGVPDEVRRRVDRRVGSVDWNRVNLDMRRLPLQLEELREIRLSQLPTVVSVRQGFPNAGRGSRPRAEGELSALATIARSGFSEMFEPVGERIYRMRMR